MEGRSDGNITVEVEEEEEVITIHIIDNGIGMPREVRESIYDPFFTTKEVGKGTGLGLSIAQGIIQAHGGKIVCSSGLHAGSIFTVSLPRVKESQQPEKATQPQGHESGVSTSRVQERPAVFGAFAPVQSDLRILLVDDEDLIRSALTRFLSSYRYEVVGVPDGQKALAVAHELPFDWVISDIRMPRMNGLDFYRGMLEVDHSYSNRFIFMTGDLISTDLIVKVRETRCPCLEKPFAFERLLELMPKEKKR
jgi:CheY-like chemotaxis protein